MKFTVFGLTLSSSWGNGHATPYRAIVRALHRLGHEVTFFEKEVPYYSRRRDLVDPDFCRLVLYSDWDSVRRHALEEAAASDVVIVGSFCPEGARIGDDVLELATPLRVFYDLDTPVTFSRIRGEGACDYLHAGQIRGYDLFLSFTGGNILDELRQEWGARLARPLYGCVDPDVHARVPARPDFQCELSYMGTYAADRQKKVDALFVDPALRLKDRSFLLAGSLYPREWQWPANVRRVDHVAPADHAALYSSSRATLNVTREEMARAGWCPSGRFFEAAACGTPLLTDNWLGLGDFFDTDSELFVVWDCEDVLRVLRMPGEVLARTAERARERTLDQHTGMRRAEQLLAYCEEARNPVAKEHAAA